MVRLTLAYAHITLVQRFAPHVHRPTTFGVFASKTVGHFGTGKKVASFPSPTNVDQFRLPKGQVCMVRYITRHVKNNSTPGKHIRLLSEEITDRL